MSTPTTKSEFKEYCLRELGKPVINIDVHDTQVDDRIDQALKYYADYHYDGSEKTYYKYQVTEQDVTNRYITLPENIIGVVKIFKFTSIFNSTSLFDIRYQVIMNQLYQLNNVTLAPYVSAMTNLHMIESILVNDIPVRYNRHTDRLYLDMDWEKAPVGSYLMIEAYQVIDPDTYTDVWSDRWLAKYTTALIKRQWGNNLKKFNGVELPGGVRLNGQQIFNEAEDEIRQLEHEMIYSYSIPVSDAIG